MLQGVRPVFHVSRGGAILSAMRSLVSFFAVVLSLFLLPSPAFALTQEEAKLVALENVPGKIKLSNHHVAGDTSIYEFEIEKEDGALVEIELNAFTGQLMCTRVKRFSKGSPEPEPTVPVETAWDAALKAVNAIKGAGAAERGAYARLVLLNGRLAHELHVRKIGENGTNQYDVHVDAGSGGVLSVREDE